jgi:hypothetical protein
MREKLQKMANIHLAFGPCYRTVLRAARPVTHSQRQEKRKEEKKKK